MIGRRIALMMPKIAATTISVHTFCGVESVVSAMPSINTVASHSENAVISRRMMMPMASDRAMTAPARGPTLRDLVPVVAKNPAYLRLSTGLAQKLRFDGGLGQRRPPDRPAVDPPHHVRPDAGHPLRDLA